MSVFRTLSILLVLLNVLIIDAQNIKLESSKFQIELDTISGGLQSIKIVDDLYLMNWILKSDSSQYPWQTSKFAWGLGFAEVDGKSISWEKAESILSKRNLSIVKYKMPFITLTVTRQIQKNGQISESYQFSNTSTKTINVTDVGIYTPFNDNYPDAKTCVHERCNAHIWAGGNSSYVFAQRMGGDAPHLGLVLTEGALRSYEILNRSRNVYPWKLSGSNVRGTIALKSEDFSLEPGISHTIAWAITSADNWNDFLAQAKIKGFVKAQAENYVVQDDENLLASFESSKKLKNVHCFLNGNKVPFVQNGTTIHVNVPVHRTGDQTLKLLYGNGKETVLNAYRIEDIVELMKKRAHFIVDKQQLKDTSDVRNGAYLVYDNELKKIYLNDDERKSSDLNEGRERIGMGIFLAMYLQKYPDEKILASLKRYHQFVKTKLQRDDYSIRNGIDSDRHRPYNYTWVAHFYLELYKLTGDRTYLLDYYHTQHKYFIDSKYQFYAIDVPISDGLNELKKTGLKEEYNTLLADARKTAANFIETSIYYPKSEVNYEQSIVGPSVILLLEMYQITNENKYLNEAEKQLKALEAFGGKQPDYHLNDIAIRHWDGYWFGKKQYWGDVFPHYWSAITSEAFARYALVTGKQDYMQRAKTIVRNNLCQFFEDGSASCAYLYPEKVNGKQAAFFDPFINDQDFALVYYLKYQRLIDSNKY